MIKLLEAIFCSNNQCYTQRSYEIVVNWFEVMLKRLIKKESKSTGTIIGIFRVINVIYRKL